MGKMLIFLYYSSQRISSWRFELSKYQRVTIEKQKIYIFPHIPEEKSGIYTVMKKSTNKCHFHEDTSCTLEYQLPPSENLDQKLMKGIKSFKLSKKSLFPSKWAQDLAPWRSDNVKQERTTSECELVTEILHAGWYSPDSLHTPGPCLTLILWGLVY